MLASEERAAQRQTKRVQAKESTRERTLAGVTHALDMYQERLGLAFHHPEDREELDIVFTRVDAAAPDREFRLAVHVLDGDRYEGEKERKY